MTFLTDWSVFSPGYSVLLSSLIDECFPPGTPFPTLQFKKMVNHDLVWNAINMECH